MSPRLNKRVFFGCLLVLMAFVMPRAQACMWDSDTLAAEIKGMPGVAEIIVGRFERNPKLYFEMRLERVTRALEADPTNLGNYDDAGVSSDRIGASDDAIAWMARKHEQMAAMDLTKEVRWTHEYRYLANLGTFHAHRWLKNGADRQDLADLEEAERLIAAAIELNPDAHFGREKYQLMAIQAILRPVGETEAFKGKFGGEVYPTLLDNPDNQFALSVTSGAAMEGYLAQHHMEDAVTGLTGLVVLGAAWESVDIFHSLSMALAIEGEASLALLAKLRAQELIDDGKYPILPGLPEHVHRRVAVGVQTSMATEPDKIFDFYAAARASADQWASNREAYMLERLQAGQHPDTDPAFWDAWNDQPAMPAAPTSLATATTRGASQVVLWIIGGAALAVTLILGAVVVMRLTSRRSPQPADA
jgi:tetratricopeptide (TPR) repeat protein